jgi:diacylglycerol kinase family enzyme
MPHALILGNPYSGSGPNRRRVGRLEAALEGQGVRYATEWERDRWPELMRDASPDTVFIIAGGDGTIGSALNLMRDAGRLDAPFATLPIGTESLVAREFGFTKTSQIAADVAAGRTRPVDLGDANGTLFTLMASTGFDAEVVRRVDLWRNDTPDGSLKRVHRLKYALPMAKALGGYRFPQVTVNCDGQTFHGAHAFVFNIPQYGGNLKLAADAQPDDGLLDFVIYKHPGRTHLVRFGAMVLLRQHAKSKAVVAGQAKQITITHNGTGPGTTPVPAQIDGDPLDHTPLTIKVLPAALNVIDTRKEPAR